MSTLYPDCPLTLMPVDEDAFNRLEDLSISDLALAASYESKYSAGDIAGANQILTDNPSLANKIINANNINKLRDAIIALERFYLNDIQSYITNIVQNKGEYSPVTKYEKYNVVTYANAGAVSFYIANKSDVPIGTIPTNTSYWTALTWRGEQGVSGIGLSPRGQWSNIINYNINDCVAYNNALWQCLADNINSVPVEDSNWTKLLDIPKELIVSDIEPNSGLQVENETWFKSIANNVVQTFVKNATGTYDQKFFETKASAVTTTDTKTVQEKLNTHDTDISNLQTFQTGLSVTKIIISTTQPTIENGALWIKPKS